MHNWDDLKYFYTVATLGSFSQAAQKLGVNHSTVGRRIAALESSHGVRLLERTQKGYQLTEAGSQVFELAEDMHNTSLKASRVMLGQDARLEGRITLTMPHEIFEHILAEPLAQYCQQHPQIDMILSVAKGLRNMANREADIAVRITPSPPDYLIGHQISHMQHGIYVRRDLALTDETPLVVWSAEHQVPAWANEQFENPRIALHVDDLMTMHQAVRAGFGVARMPCFLPDRLKDDAVTKLPVALPASHWGIWVLYHADLRNTARINHCKRFLIEQLNQYIPLIQGQLS